MPMPVTMCIDMCRSSMAVAMAVAGLGGLDDSTQNVRLRIQAGHPSLNDRRALLLHTDLDVREPGAQQLPL